MWGLFCLSILTFIFRLGVRIFLWDDSLMAMFVYDQYLDLLVSGSACICPRSASESCKIQSRLVVVSS